MSDTKSRLAPYFSMRLNLVKREDEDLISSLCFDYGALGVSENLKFIQDFDNYAPVTVEVDVKNLDVYFDSAPSAELINELTDNYKVEVSVDEKANKDWMSEWKKNFKAFSLAGPFWIVPSWLEVPPEAGASLFIDPGMAFGTGTHETTKIASVALYEMLEGKDLKKTSMIDVGTGTGVLAILAYKMGVKNMVAIEIDEDARAVAVKNCFKNMCERIQIPPVGIERVAGKYDFVVANIIDGVLVNIQEDLKRLLAPKGKLLVTGILEERKEIFESNFNLKISEGIELKKIKSYQEGQWMGFVYEVMA